MQITTGGADVAVTEQSLDGIQIDPAFEQVGSKAMAQGMDATGLSKVRPRPRAVIGALGRLDGQVAVTVALGKQPLPRVIAAHVQAQVLTQGRREQRVTVLCALALRLPSNSAI